MKQDKLIRLDIMLSKKFIISRVNAQNYIKDEKVFVNNKKIAKPAFKVSDNDKLFVEFDKVTFVSRGGLKLLKALNEFNIDVKNKVCLDVGSSTGGFTHCLLKNGAEKIYAIDVGSMQLDESLRNNKKIILYENMNITDLSIEDTNGKVDIIVIDVSFISITKVFHSLKKFLKENTKIICLIKPQFEVGLENLKKGIVKDKKIHRKLLSNLITYFKEEGFFIQNLTYSPIKGLKGNIEYLIELSINDPNLSNLNIFPDEIVEDAYSSLK